MKTTLRSVLLAAICFGMASYTLADEPKRPECIAPASPGGGFDLTCKLAQSALLDGKHLSSPMRVTYMPGGIGAVAFNQFNTNRADDGSAIVAFSTGSLLNIITGKYGAFDENSVRWVATAGADFGAVIVRADSEYQTLKDVMDDLSTDPQGVVVGAGGSVGSQDWMKGALLMREAGGTPMQMRYVAFDGGGDAIAALLGGSIEVYTGDVGEMVPYLDSGDLRVLGVLAPERLDAPFDEIPTAKEQGFDVEWTILRGFYMGGQASDEDYQKWVDAFNAAYATEDFAKVQQERGLLPLNMAGAELDAAIAKSIETLREISIEAGLIQ